MDIIEWPMILQSNLGVGRPVANCLLFTKLLVFVQSIVPSLFIF